MKTPIEIMQALMPNLPAELLDMVAECDLDLSPFQYHFLYFVDNQGWLGTLRNFLAIYSYPEDKALSELAELHDNHIVDAGPVDGRMDFPVCMTNFGMAYMGWY